MSERQYRKEWLANFRGLKAEEMEAREREMKEEHFWLNLKSASNQLENPLSVRKARRNVARAKTILRENQTAEKKGSTS